MCVCKEGQSTPACSLRGPFQGRQAPTTALIRRHREGCSGSEGSQSPRPWEAPRVCFLWAPRQSSVERCDASSPLGGPRSSSSARTYLHLQSRETPGKLGPHPTLLCPVPCPHPSLQWIHLPDFLPGSSYHFAQAASVCWTPALKDPRHPLCGEAGPEVAGPEVAWQAGPVALQGG